MLSIQAVVHTISHAEPTTLKGIAIKTALLLANC